MLNSPMLENVVSSKILHGTELADTNSAHKQRDHFHFHMFLNMSLTTFKGWLRGYSVLLIIM